MNKLLIIILLLLPLGESFSDEAKIASRINDDKNIMGYIVINAPDKLYLKLSDLSKSLSQNYLEGLEEEMGAFLPIIQDATSIVIVYYSFEEDISIGYFITVKNKNVFDSVYITALENKEIINNTLIFSEEDEDTLKVFKSLHTKISLISSKNDVDFLYDINHSILKNANEKKFTPNKLNLLNQFDYISGSFNLNKLDITYEMSLRPTLNSNLQKMLTQPKIESTTLLDALGKSNLFLNISQFDFSKAAPFIADFNKSFIENESNTNDEKKKEEAINIFENVGLVQFATKLNFDKNVSRSHILKFDGAKKIITDFIKNTNNDSSFILNPTLTKLLSYCKNEYFLGFFDEFFEIQLDELVEDNLKENNVKVSTFEKTDEFDIFKISFEDKQSNKIIDETKSIYFSANSNFVALADLLEDTKALSSKLKLPSTKNSLTLESIEYFKSGYSSYSDLNIQTFFKSILASEGDTFGIQLFNKFFKGNLKSLKLATKMEGNLSLHLQVDIATIKPLLELFLEEYFGVIDENEEGDEDENKKPNNQP
jgi:hypothetical protein